MNYEGADRQLYKFLSLLFTMLPFLKSLYITLSDSDSDFSFASPLAN